jgi:hypothetical protein
MVIMILKIIIIIIIIIAVINLMIAIVMIIIINDSNDGRETVERVWFQHIFTFRKKCSLSYNSESCGVRRLSVLEPLNIIITDCARFLFTRFESRNRSVVQNRKTKGNTAQGHLLARCVFSYQTSGTDFMFPTELNKHFQKKRV